MERKNVPHTQALSGNADTMRRYPIKLISGLGNTVVCTNDRSSELRQNNFVAFFPFPIAARGPNQNSESHWPANSLYRLRNEDHAGLGSLYLW
jgi:hypothetical protein